MFRNCHRLFLQQHEGPRKLYSHIIGVHLYSTRPQAALQFYTYTFQAAAAAAAAKSSQATATSQEAAEGRVCAPQMLLRSQSPAIAPLTIEAVESRTTTPPKYSIPKGNVPRWALKIAHSESTLLDTFASKLPRDIATENDLQNASTLEFLCVDANDSTLKALHAAQLCAPFSSQPRVTGVVNWCDLVVDDGTEASTAMAASTLFQWRRTTAITFPDREDKSKTHQYITALNSTEASGGGVQNRDKLCGIVPRSVLLPQWRPHALRKSTTSTTSFSTVMPFFAVANVEALRAARDVAVSLGGAVHAAEIEADGVVSLLQDSEGLPFALYARADEWHGVKPTTVIAE